MLKLVWVLLMFGGKYYQENAKNGICERPDFEVLWRSIPPDSPIKAPFFGASQLPRLSEKFWLRPWETESYPPNFRASDGSPKMLADLILDTRRHICVSENNRNY